MLSDWPSKTGFPHIAVGSLASAANKQGAITEVDWKRIKEQLVNSSQAQPNQWVDMHTNKLERHDPPSVQRLQSRAHVAELESENAVITYGSGAAVIDGKQIEFNSAPKLVYANKCLVYLLVAVDARSPNAQRQVTEFVAGTNIIQR